ncbi:MAG TPA: hypothetical protein VMH23_08560 [Bacteroidota bacterium]|nr:hypothetical protein [Bacteroidota bacterium]
MGSASKIILIGATSLIVGIYAVSLKKVQTNDVNTALVEVNRVQFERVQAAAVRSALSLFYSYGGGDLSGTRTALGGGTFTYSFTSHWNSYVWDPRTYSYGAYDYTNLTVTVYLNGVPRVVTARVERTDLSGSYGYVKQGPRKMHRASWEVTKYYVQRDR